MIQLLVVLLFIFQVEPNDAERRLQDLFEDQWEYSLEVNPLFATGQGVHEWNHKLPETGLEALAARAKMAESFLERLQSIPREQLSEQSRLNYDIFKMELEGGLSAFERNDHLLPLNGWWDYHATFAELPNRVPLRTSDDYENYIKRLQAFLEFSGGYIERMRKGIELGVVRPKMVFDDYLASIEGLVTDQPEESRLYEPFVNLPDRFTAEKREDLRIRGAEAIRESVNPAYRELLRFLEDEYIPNAAASIAITDVPGGEEYYQFLIRHHTTLNLTAEEIHETGLSEVKRIRNGMQAIIDSLGFEGSFDEFLTFLRTDPQFYAETPEELLKETAYVLKRMDGKLPELFKTLPRLPYGIQPVPDHLAPRTTTAYYSRGAADGTRAGYYAVNTYDLKSRPLYEITALSLHEAVPGHHLQIALQQELEGLPKFRSVTSFTAYTEGWALYAEQLGLEVGLYDDPYSRFGQLSYEMWRALRLVVDTGMHAMGWSRDEAISFMAEHSALSMHNIRAEVNRYIFWPGQALAYKMGEIKIRELRSKAEEQLGESFDQREFHDVILINGNVPLSVLEEKVEEWSMD